LPDGLAHTWGEQSGIVAKTVDDRHQFVLVVRTLDRCKKFLLLAWPRLVGSSGTCNVPVTLKFLTDLVQLAVLLSLASSGDPVFLSGLADRLGVGVAIVCLAEKSAYASLGDSGLRER
jgi:hypothetical protein